ncbi:hypothetical protein J6590_044980 [Homalodisca vitripennis]|nr:hypothetical protein J6590_044980 [Homalodisca vitripennis]
MADEEFSSLCESREGHRPPWRVATLTGLGSGERPIPRAGDSPFIGDTISDQSLGILQSKISNGNKSSIE